MKRSGRIWELDALRGICILCVVFIHLMFDLVYFAGLPITFHPVYLFIQQYGGVIFVVLSGLCATLGHKSFRRGVVVFAAGMLITLVTWGMTLFGMLESTEIVRFGVLHLLGICMMLYPLYKKLPTAAMAVIGVCLVILGYTVTQTVVETKLLFPFGFLYPGFSSGDYFPLLPHLGWYMLGSVLGRTVYREKKTLLPGRAQDASICRFFCFCGRQSLWIYLLHQPLCYGILELVLLLKK